MSKDDAIGGYFELELRQGEEFHAKAIALNSARNCLEYILLARKYRKVYIPLYTCEVVLEPFHRHNIAYEFYSVNMQLEPSDYPELAADEAFLYTNYFGLKQEAVEKIASLYGKQTIIDNAQAFYAPPLPGIDTFYSPRKFFGVADGGYLYTDAPTLPNIPRDYSWERMQHLTRRADESAEAGYSFFRTNSESLSNAPIRYMSRLTKKIMCSCDYAYAKKQRLANYRTLTYHLSSLNLLNITSNIGAIPMAYPLLSNDVSLRNRLIQHRIYVATYWPNIFQWAHKQSLEQVFTKKLIPIPIDHRYSEEDMRKIVDIIR
ncbi:MAG: hypothetical protein IJY53_03375 [Akkermansia sp.]|nr:hypothetical protein [Akkermansia sp.]